MARLYFFKRFLRSPSTIGSITPSSHFLAKKMVNSREVQSAQTIIELGAGTGIFTRYLVKMKQPDARLYVFEKDPLLAERLRRKFPGIEVFSDAADLEELVRSGALTQADLIVSGIPFAVLPAMIRQKILLNVFSVLRPGGKFVTFQYSFDLLKELKKTYPSVNLQFVLLNMPPAVIYRCTK